MTLGGQFRTSVRSIQAVGVSPKALSGGGLGEAGAPPSQFSCPRTRKRNAKAEIRQGLEERAELTLMEAEMERVRFEYHADMKQQLQTVPPVVKKKGNTKIVRLPTK